ncbi:universal stress protein [Falsiroseomonas sp. E2-1-a20]|uniref:universal stress protein n=1 Tax=Falsiroseomonas sp. E2-1-a20 TaxID=3239300 RepID=UPI003F3EAB86
MSATRTDPAWQNGTPKRILLATDLSSRCDRAQDRAARLAEDWGATLHLLNVIPGKEPPEVPSWRRSQSEAVQAAERHIRADLQGTLGEVVIERGEPAEAILRQAAALDCQLIVTGVARDEMMGRAAVGRIVEHLVQQSPVPVLVVKRRARRDYGEVVVATDFSPTSRHALDCALAWLPEAAVTLFHAFQIPFEGILGRDAHMAEMRQLAATDQEDFLATVPEAARARIQFMLKYGPADAQLARYVADREVNLTVLGTQGRSGLAGFLVGSVAKRLLACLPSDVLMVRQPRA